MLQRRPKSARKRFTRSALRSYCWEGADRTALSGIAVQHADDGYSRRGNFYGFSLVRNMVLIYSAYMV